MRGDRAGQEMVRADAGVRISKHLRSRGVTVITSISLNNVFEAASISESSVSIEFLAHLLECEMKFLIEIGEKRTRYRL